MSSNNIYKPKLTDLEAYQIALNEIQRLKAENEKLKKDLQETESELKEAVYLLETCEPHSLLTGKEKTAWIKECTDLLNRNKEYNVQ